MVWKQLHSRKAPTSYDVSKEQTYVVRELNVDFVLSFAQSVGCFNGTDVSQHFNSVHVNVDRSELSFTLELL